MQELPLVAIIGRTNVGKSTLFNRLSETRKAIVSRLAGTTRDRTYSEISWRNKIFKLVDTGGLDLFDQTTITPQKKFQKEMDTNIQEQARFAIAEADLILFLVDAKSGLLPQDKTLANFLKKTKKPIILVINKADKLVEKTLIDNDFYKLNLEPMMAVSAANGTGCGDLLDLMDKNIPLPKTKKIEKPEIKISIIGRPNVGKSTFFNSLINKKQAVVSALPHTTRDANDFSFIYHQQPLTIIDTAGLRKQSKVGEVRGQDKNIKKELSLIEKSSVNQAILAIKKSDIVVLMIEALKSISTQDKKIAQIIADNKKPAILLINKWDLIPDKNANTINEYLKYFFYHLPMLKYAYPLFISALEKQRVRKILDIIIDINQKANQEINQEILDEFLAKFISKNKPQKKKISRNIQRKNKHLELKRLKQVGQNPPVFAVFTPRSKDVSFAYLNLLENKLKELFDFKGVPIFVRIKK